MKSLLIAAFLALASSFPVVAQDDGPAQQTSRRPDQTPQTPAQLEVIQELNEAARCYHDGDFLAAQEHSEKALLLDPASRTAQLFVARTIHAQYKPGDQREANVAKANDAIAAYKRIRLQNPLSEEAYTAIAFLYGASKQAELQRQWILQRALDPNVATEKRSEAYVVLASKAWDCSFKITELPSNKTVSLSTRKATVHYHKPTDPADFENAQQCAAEGLELVEAAITLEPESEMAWSYKSNLLIEMSKLAEMDHKRRLKAEYDRQMNEAGSKTRDLSDRKTNPPTEP